MAQTAPRPSQPGPLAGTGPAGPPCPWFSRMSVFQPAPSPAPCWRPPRRGRQDGGRLHPPGCARPAAQSQMRGTADAPARVLRFLRPPVEIGRRTERIVLLVGAAALYAG